MEAQEESRSGFGHSLKCCLLFKMNGVASQPSRSAHPHPHHSWNNFAHSSSLPQGVGPSVEGILLGGIMQRGNPVPLNSPVTRM